MQIFKDLIDDIYRICTVVPRIAAGAKASYMSEMTGNSELEKYRAGIMENLQSTSALCENYRENLEQYSYLWTVCF